MGLEPRRVTDLLYARFAVCAFGLEKFDVDLVVQLDEIIYLVFSELSYESVF